LAGERFIGFASDQPTRRVLDRAFKEAGVRMRLATEFDNIELVKRKVEIDGAASILPRTALGTERRAGSLVSVEIDSPRMWRPIGAIARRRRSSPLAMRRFLELLRAGRAAGAA
jgi:DNA-binding transcriptional LysR family regulator